MANPQIGFVWSENFPIANFTSSAAPYEINTLKPNNQFYSQIQGTSNPSQPNYCGMSSGSELNKAGNDAGPWPFANTTQNIFSQLQAANFTWKTYEEGLYNSGTGAPIALKHNPAAFFNQTNGLKGTATTPAGTNNIRVDFTGTAGLTADINNGNLPDFFWITPNMDNCGHDTNVTFWDHWLQGLSGVGGHDYVGRFPGLPALLGAMRPEGIVIVGDDGHSGGSPKVTYYASITTQPVTPVPPIYGAAGTHFNVLWAIQQAFGLPKFNQSLNPLPLDSKYTASSLVAIPLPLSTSLPSNPVASVAPSTINFPNTDPGATSTTSNVTISNTGSANLTIPAGGIAITGASASKFSIVSGAATSQVVIAAGANRVVGVRFNPALADARGTAFSATLVFTDDSNGVAGSTQSTTLNGTVTPATASATVSPRTLNFSTAAGSTSNPQTVTVTNNGSVAISFAASGSGTTVPPGVPQTSAWLYAAPSPTWCQVGVAPSSSAIPGAEAFSNNNRQFWVTDFGGDSAAGGKGPWFNPDARTQAGATFLNDSGVQAVPVDWTDFIKDLNGTGNAGHNVDPVGNILGSRGTDPSWPSLAAMQAWVYGDGSYTDTCVNKWNALMLTVPRKVMVRMWHEFGNNNQTTTWSKPDFIAMWQKVCTRFRQLGGLAPNKCQVVWCPASHPTSPASDVDRFPGTYPNNPGGTDVIGRDMYPKETTSWGDAGDLWYNEFNPFNGPSNVDRVPLVVCESGLVTTDANRSTKLQELVDRLTGRFSPSWTGISGWIWWDGASNDIIDTPTGFKAKWVTAWNDPILMPNGLLPGGSGGGSSALVISGTGASQFSIQTDGLSGQTINPGASKTCTVVFSPPTGSTTVANATLTITDSSGQTQTQPVTLSGTPISSSPIATVAPISHDFGSVISNTNSTNFSTTVTNTGGNPSSLAITNVALTGANANQFGIVSDTGQSSLAFNAARTVVVRFSPTSTGAKSANLTFTDNSGGTAGVTQSIALTGTGTAGTGTSVITPASPIQMPDTAVGSTSTQILTVTNTGNGPLTIGQLSIGPSTGVGGNVNPKNKVSFSSTTNSVAATNPSNTVSGDFLMAEVTANAGTNSTAPDAGWVKVLDRTSGSLYKAVWRRFAASSTDGQGTWTATGATSIVVTLHGASNVNPSTPIRVSASAGGTNAITAAPPALTGLTTNDKVYAFNGTTAGPQPFPDKGKGVLLSVMPAVSIGDWINPSGITALENVLGRKVAQGHSWQHWQQTSLPTTTGPVTDFNNGRLSYISWFHEGTGKTWPEGDSGDPTVGLQHMAAGNDDQAILDNATMWRNFKHPIVFRPFPEFNGGDHPYEIGYTVHPAANKQAWITAFIAAWQRVWAITRGSDADIAAFAPGYSLNSGHSAGATNLLFNWNVQNFETSGLSRDTMYPGDQFVDLVGTEMYLTGSNTFDGWVKQTSSNGATHAGIINYCNGTGVAAAPSTGNKFGGNGEGGPKYANDDAACITRINSMLSGSKSNPSHVLFSWWNSNDSQIENFPAGVKSACVTLLNDPYWNPVLDRSWNTPTGGWTEITQYRCRLGGADTNFGAEMIGTQAYQKDTTTSSLTPPSVTGFGFGDWASISIALIPGGGASGNVAPFGGTVSIDNMAPNYDGVNTITLTATPSGWSGNPAITGGMYSYQWKRDGSTNIGTGATYVLQAADVGHTVGVVLTVNNGVSPNGTATATTAVVTNNVSSPVNTVKPTVPANPVVGIAQTATQGTWTGTTSFSFQWQRINPNNSVTTLAGNGATTLTYTPQAADLNSKLQIIVTGWSGASQTGTSAQATSTPSNAVTNTVQLSIFPAPPGTAPNPFPGLPKQTDDTYTLVTPSGTGGTVEDSRAVWAVCQVGNTDYWGGTFTGATSPGGANVTRNHFMAVNSSTGALLSFAPNFNGEVRNLQCSADGQFLYVCGAFTSVTIGSTTTTANRLCRINLNNNTIDQSWLPSVTGGHCRGMTLSPDGTKVYIGGAFTTVNGTARGHLAAVNVSDGSLVTAFNSSVSGAGAVEVRKIKFCPGDSAHVYIVGLFDTFTHAGTNTSMLALAQLQASDGSLTSWRPDIAGTITTSIGHDICFMPDGSACFVSCAGADTGGDGNSTMRYELSPTIRNVRSWTAHTDGDNNCCETNGTYVWIGHHGDGTQSLATINNVGTKKICCVRASDGTGGTNGSGQKTSLWQANPQFNGIKGTYIILATNDHLKVGGGWSTPNEGAAIFGL